ncbi:MAG: hypothetical protein HC773_20430 [Scytonema sp. CRU_2_7]|nr:hypothetical protein [Scytonema sp. CRU_2_7]
MAEGSVYDFFDESLHRGSRFPHAKQYKVSIDYGTGNPTSFGLYGINKSATPKAWRIKGYWWDSKKEGRQKTDTEYSKDLKDFLTDVYCDGRSLGDIHPSSIIIDPSAASFKLQISKDHPQYFVQDANNDVLDGIRTQAKMLQSGEYMISSDSSNDPCVKEYYAYSWDRNAAKRGLDKPLKQDDHTKDDERYFLHTEFGDSQLDYNILTRM